MKAALPCACDQGADLSLGAKHAAYIDSTFPPSHSPIPVKAPSPANVPSSVSKLPTPNSVPVPSAVPKPCQIDMHLLSRMPSSAFGSGEQEGHPMPATSVMFSPIVFFSACNIGPAVDYAVALVTEVW